MIGLTVFIYFVCVAGLRVHNWKNIVTKLDSTNTYEFNYRHLKRR